MDALGNSRELTGIWVNGERIASHRVVACDAIGDGMAAEIRIAKDILRHELEAAQVTVRTDLAEFVRSDLMDFGSQAFGGYLSIASAARRFGRPKASFLNRLLRRRKEPEPEWLIRVSEDVGEDTHVIVIKTVAERTRAEQPAGADPAGRGAAQP